MGILACSLITKPTMTKRVPKEVSAYMSKIGKAGYRAKVKKILKRAAQRKVELPPVGLDEQAPDVARKINKRK